MRRTDRTAGFSLIEVMIAMSLTSVVLAVTLTSYREMSDAADGAGLTTDMNVNLRSTVNLMTRDLLGAGGRNIPVGGLPVPSGPDALPIRRPSPLDDLTFPAAPTIPAVTPGNGLGPAIGDNPDTVAVEGVQTDVVTILATDPTLPLDSVPLAAVAPNGRSVTVDPAVPIDGTNGVAAGDLIWLRNALGNTLMMVTARNGQNIEFGDGDVMALNQVDAQAGTVMQLLGGGGPILPITATRVQMITYYIDDTDRARPRLVRRLNMREPRVIGVVVDNLQLTYDLVDGVNNPTNVADPMNANQIRKANLFVAGRSSRPWRRTQEFVRTAVSTQISLRSLAFVDRYQ